MRYQDIEQHLRNGGTVVLDGGTGTELERRGVTMDPEAWCGPATLDNLDVLEAIHRDYLEAGADVITANTYASSPLMLAGTDYSERFEEINRAALEAARRARAASGKDEVLIAGSLSHMCPMVGGTAQPDLARAPSGEDMAAGFSKLARLLRDEGCDLIILEMMYYPERIVHVFEAARDSGLPVWAGFSARRGAGGRVLSYAPERDIPFTDILAPLDAFEVAAAGVMHTPADLVGEAMSEVSTRFDGFLMAYPDSGYFKMPQWQFEDVIAPDELLRFATGWVDAGVQIIGGCCGLSPRHIEALATLKK